MQIPESIQEKSEEIAEKSILGRREVQFLLMRKEDMSYKEIAKRMGVANSTVPVYQKSGKSKKEKAEKQLEEAKNTLEFLDQHL